VSRDISAVVLVVLFSVVTGCVTFSKRMIHPDSGKVMICRQTGLVGCNALYRLGDHDSCVNKLKRRGYQSPEKSHWCAGDLAYADPKVGTACR
jgi:hypothetical protein